MALSETQQQAYAFLLSKANSAEEFVLSDLQAATGWKEQTARTYMGKQYRAYVTRRRGKYVVRPFFRRLSLREFSELVTQVRSPISFYERSTYHHLVIYDFLLPLTREDKLRAALDALFYKDTLAARISDVGLAAFRSAIKQKKGESDEDYSSRIITFIGDRIGGFSISHVSGRFRDGEIADRDTASKIVKDGGNYLIDETTAVVRFILPCLTSQAKHQAPTFPDVRDTPALEPKTAEEIEQIRRVFLEIFVEAVVPTIQGEKLIWVLETSPHGRRLYQLWRAGEADDEDSGDAPGIGAEEGADEVTLVPGESAKSRVRRATAVAGRVAKSKATPSREDARSWLRTNGFAHVADQIDLLQERWAKAGKKTRRNWWDVLAGGRRGREVTIDGITFPVFAAAQKRQGVPVTENAVRVSGE